MRKIEIIELVKDYLAGGDASGDVKGHYHDEIIANHLSTAFKKVVFDTWMEAKMHSDYSLLDAWARYQQAILIDDGSDEMIAYLPFPPMQLPNSMGILEVVPLDTSEIDWLPQRNITFAYRETNSSSVFNALESGLVSTKPYFYLEQTFGTSANLNLYHLRCGNVPDGFTWVSIKMIVPFEAMDDYDPMAIPAGKENLLVRSVIDLLAGKPPEDEIFDSKSKRL
jgi:hypothetical protein